nr:DUF3311 domain-containing protein [Halovivax cerinus]
MSRVERLGWVAAMAVVVALTVPWFLWGSDRLVAGLPLWLWWFVGWMCLAAVVFGLFARRAWGLGITHSVGSDRPAGERS